jgi:asperthecin polyketide synthase
MQRVALAEDTQEATADIVLDNDRHGTWHTPPHWIDSTFQLAGFVMNAFGVQGEGETAGSSRDFFYITPGWRHLRLAERLEPGPDVTYRNYVRMFPVEGEPGAFAGDIYLLRAEKVVGVCAGIKFKRVPRALMPLMFPRRQAEKSHSHGVRPANINTTSHAQLEPTPAATSSEPEDLKPPAFAIPHSRRQDHIGIIQATESVASPSPSPPAAARQGQTEGEQHPRVADCLQLVADETGLDMEDLSGEAAFTDLGVDSLMSLALAGKIRAELGIDVQASIFLECTTVQDLVNWLSK